MTTNRRGRRRGWVLEALEDRAVPAGTLTIDFSALYGSGVNQLISITSLNSNQATVSVEGFAGPAFTNPVPVPGSQGQMVYSSTIDLTGSILVNAAGGYDQVEIDATLGVPVTVNGMSGTDSLVVQGNGLASGTYTPGTNGNPSLSGTVAVGVTTIAFGAFGPGSTVTVQGVPFFTVRSPGGADNLTLDTPAANLQRISGTVADGVPMVPALLSQGGVEQLTVDAGGGADVVNVQGTSVPTTILGGPGSDAINVSSDAPADQGSLAGIAAPLTVDGGANGTALHISNFAGPAGSGTLTGSLLTGFGLPAGGISYTNVATLEVDLSCSPLSDSLNITGTHAGTFTRIAADGGNDVIAVGNGLSAIAGPLTIDGAPNLTSLLVSNLAGMPGIGMLTRDHLTGFGMAAGIHYSSIATLSVDLSGRPGADLLEVTGTNASTLTTINGHGGNDTVQVGSALPSLSGLNGPLRFNGGGDGRLVLLDQGDPGARTYVLTATSLQRSGAGQISYAGVGQFQLGGGRGNNIYVIGGTGAAATSVDDGGGNSSFVIQGNGLTGVSTFRGNGGNNTFTLSGGGGVKGEGVTLDGGSGNSSVNFIGRSGADPLLLRLTSAVGSSVLTGLGQAVLNRRMDHVHIDGRGGMNSLAVVNDTGLRLGSPLNLRDALVYRPTGAAAGDVFVPDRPLLSAVSFSNINGSFAIYGGAGARDTLVVLGTSTTGYASGFGETTSADGSDLIGLSDTSVSILNAALGLLRPVALGQRAGHVSFAAVVVEAGNEAIGGGDTVSAVPSRRMNLLVDGMGPAGGSGDTLDVLSQGAWVLLTSNDPSLGPPQRRFYQVADNASVGWINVETLQWNGAVLESGGGA